MMGQYRTSRYKPHTLKSYLFTIQHPSAHCSLSGRILISCMIHDTIIQTANKKTVCAHCFCNVIPGDCNRPNILIVNEQLSSM